MLLIMWSILKYVGVIHIKYFVVLLMHLDIFIRTNYINNLCLIQPLPSKFNDNFILFFNQISASQVQFISVTQLCPTLCEPMDCSTPGLPVHHQLPQFTQTHVHWVSDAIQPSHPRPSPSSSAFNLSQRQGLFQWLNLFFLGYTPFKSYLQ